MPTGLLILTLRRVGLSTANRIDSHPACLLSGSRKLGIGRTARIQSRPAQDPLAKCLKSWLISEWIHQRISRDVNLIVVALIVSSLQHINRTRLVIDGEKAEKQRTRRYVLVSSSPLEFVNEMFCVRASAISSVRHG